MKMILFTLWMFLSSVSAHDFDVDLLVDRMIETQPNQTLDLGWSIMTEARNFSILFMHGNDMLAERLRGGNWNTIKQDSRITYRHPAVNHHVIQIEKVVPEDAGVYYLLIDDLDGSRVHEERRYGEIEVVVDGLNGKANSRHSTSKSIMSKALISSLCGTILLVALLIVVVSLWRRAKQNHRDVERRLGRVQRQVGHGNEYTEPTYCDVRESCMVAHNDIIRESPQVPDWENPTYSQHFENTDNDIIGESPQVPDLDDPTYSQHFENTDNDIINESPHVPDWDNPIYSQPFENTRNIFNILDIPRTEPTSKGKASARSTPEVVGCRTAMKNQAETKSLSMRDRFILNKFPKFPSNMENEYLEPLNERSNALNKSNNLKDGNLSEDGYLLPIEQRTLTLPHNYRATGIFPDEVCIVKADNSTATGSQGFSPQGYKPANPLKTTDEFNNTNVDQVEDANFTASFELVDTYLTTSLKDASLTNVSNDSKRMAPNEEQASTINAMIANFQQSIEDVNKENGAKDGDKIEQHLMSNDEINPSGVASSKWKFSRFSQRKKSDTAEKHTDKTDISEDAQDWHRKSSKSKKTFPVKCSQQNLTANENSKEEPDHEHVEGKLTDPSQFPKDGTVRDLQAKFT